jgi:N-carbamoyl-L-amino-acid hydrolase
MRDAMLRAGLTAADIADLERDVRRYLGFVEVHIEQGPVLNGLDVPLGIVTSINGSVRYLCEITGMASHAGTTPMDMRRDAAAAAAELVLFVEHRAAKEPNLVAPWACSTCPAARSTWCRGAASQSRHPGHHRRRAMPANATCWAACRICERRGLTCTPKKPSRSGCTQ